MERARRRGGLIHITIIPMFYKYNSDEFQRVRAGPDRLLRAALQKEARAAGPQRGHQARGQPILRVFVGSVPALPLGARGQVGRQLYAAGLQFQLHQDHR